MALKLVPTAAMHLSNGYYISR